jgi:hypothetical protein
LAASSHFILAFSQAAFVFGASAANVGAVNATARPKAMMIETRLFMDVSSVVVFAEKIGRHSVGRELGKAMTCR